VAAVKTIGGSVVNTAGVALPSKTVTLKNDDTGASITTTTTNADGEWEFANRDETIRYRADAAFGGSSSQVVVRKPASAEFDHLYANLSFRTAAAATVALGGALTVAGVITGLANGNQLGTAGGPAVTAAVAPTDASLLFYNLGSGNWSGVGVDGSGNTWLRTGLSGSTTPPVYFPPTGGVVVQRGTLTISDTAAAVTIGSTIAASTPFIDFRSSGHVNTYDARIVASGGTAATGLGNLSLIGTTVDVPGTLTAAAMSTGTLAVSGATTLGGRLLATDGSAAAPSLSFSAATTTGIARIGATSVSLVGNGVEALRAGGSGASPTLGFYGNTGFVKQTVSGSRAGNAALQSLLTALATIGLIGDASS
jgi:hypothetical protein